MKKRVPIVPALLVPAIAGLMLSGVACEYILPFQSTTVQNAQTYKCTAQIYRVIPGTNQEFTENWQAWIWPGANDPGLVCMDKLNNYTHLFKHGLPEFNWQIRNFNVSADPKPYAVDCSVPAPVAAYGGPVGNELALWPPQGVALASAYISLTDNNGNVQTASPTTKNVNFVYAERTGLGINGGDLNGGSYDPAFRHLRISDMRIEFNPFDIGNVHVSSFYVQSIGTVIAQWGGGIQYTILPGSAKLYMIATGSQGGNQAVTSQCFINSISATVNEVDYGSPYFTFVFDAFNVTPPGYSFSLNEIKINFATLMPTQFLRHQPQVYLKDKQWTVLSGWNPTGYLTFYPGDLIGDADPAYSIDISKILWFENFEKDNENFLGNAVILPVTLSSGQHAITVVVYDTRGSYATSTMNLNVAQRCFYPPDDFDGSFTSDILWLNTSNTVAKGTVAIWEMNGMSISSAGIPGAVNPGWQVKGVGDFNGDGRADILWQDTATGTVAIWLMNGSSSISSVGLLGVLSANWQIEGVGDFNGDGKADILWQDTTTGTVAIWLMNGTTKSSVGIPGAVPLNWQIKGVGDFNGDGKSDILWQDTITGTGAIAFMNGTAVSSVGVGMAIPLNWQIKGVGDFNGDCKADILWQDTITGTVAIMLMDGTIILSAGVSGAVGADWQIKGVGDFNNDGKADILWQHTSGAVAIWEMNGITISSVGVPGAVSPTDWQIMNK